MSTMDDLTPRIKAYANGSGAGTPPQHPAGLRRDVEESMQMYFSHLGEESVSDLYQLVLNEIELPLLEAVLRHTGSNQSKASIMLGLNRGTLRKKLKQHGLL
jgi:Fis family transcriptional regulator, factor for inversion stimulation protein